MRRFGKFVNSLNGKYWTAEDVNMSARDMEYIRMETPFVTGIPQSMGGSGDPSPVTAYGVYMGMKAAAKKTYGSDDLSNKKIIVQGAGNVGTYLIVRLVAEKANVYVSDIFEDKIANVTNKFGAVKVIDAEEIIDAEMDIYAPCALGATLNQNTIGRLKCAIVAGGANNQLDEEDQDALSLKERGIIYAPDFLINAGGITNVFAEQQGNYNKKRVMEQTERIYDVCLEVLNYADSHSVTTHRAAVQLAMDRINAIGKVKVSY